MVNHNNFDEIVELYNSRVQKIVKGFLKSGNDVDDIKQEVFIKTWRNMSKFRGDSNFWTWMSKITINVCRDYLRSGKNMSLALGEEQEDIIQNIPDKAKHPGLAVIQTERHKTILKAINSLSPKFREVLILHDIEELTYEEISNKVKCPIGTVKSRLFNARKALKLDLSNLLEQEIL